MRKVDEIEKAVDLVLKKYGKITILINGAAGNFLASLDSLSPKGFQTVVAIDLFGSFNMIKIVYEKYMKSSREPCNIINISSSMHLCGVAMQSHAGAAKAGIDALTRHFAVELVNF